MSVADGGREEGVHKKVLSSETEVYETQRLQVIFHQKKAIRILKFVYTNFLSSLSLYRKELRTNFG